jgi:hypothetical protein
MCVCNFNWVRVAHKSVQDNLALTVYDGNATKDLANAGLHHLTIDISLSSKGIVEVY